MSKMRKPKTVSYESVQTLYGGYHRYDFTDHAYLYNLYFPTPDMFVHLKKNIENLVINYPLGQQGLCRLMARWTGHDPDRLVVGNGAAELIKIISGTQTGRMIIPVPTFNEYVNAAPENRVKAYPLSSPDFRLDTEDFARAAVDAKADVAVIITPNNPTSMHIPAAELTWLVNALRQKNIRLIVDESFLDFVDHSRRASMADKMNRFSNLAVVKSMSKAFGICGLRLGYMASADKKWINAVKAGVHIWNINGMAEEFLRILPGYRDAFSSSCEQVRQDRDILHDELKTIPGLTVHRPDANFVFCRLPETAPGASAIARTLYTDHKILIKDCKGKSMPDANRHLRIASRTGRENKRLVSVLSGLLDEQKRLGDKN